MKRLHQRLKQWGEQQRRVPERNDALQAQVLARGAREQVVPDVVRASRVPWLSFALVGAAVLVIVIAPRTSMLRTEQSDTAGSMGLSAGSSAPSVAREAPLMPETAMPKSGLDTVFYGAPEPMLKGGAYPLQRDVPITDTREYLQIGYAATMRVRDVLGIGQRVQTVVRGHGGRIDTLSLNEQYGSVSFALPEDELEALRNELRMLVRTPFLLETFRMENLLPQQQFLEERATGMKESLEELVAKLGELTAAHDRAIGSLSAQLQQTRATLAAARAEEPRTTEGVVAKQERVKQLEREERRLRDTMTSENRTYDAQRSDMERRKAAQEQSLTENTEQQQDVVDQVATVRATIALRHISAFGVMTTYLAQYWIAVALGLFALAALAWYRWRAHR
ncbi:MAG: hypothetical protein Q7T01_00310 [bacterium]|nr:hypothetical protein [bacterium]